MFTWNAPLTGTPNGDGPSVLNASYNIHAEVEVPHGGGDEMLITQGGRFAGYGFYLLEGKPVFLCTLVDLKRIRWEGPDVLSPGKHVLEVDGKAVAEEKMERTIPFILQCDENLDVGSDTGSPVNDWDYQVPFAFNGAIDEITLRIDRPQLTPEDEKKLMEAQRNNKTSE